MRKSRQQKKGSRKKTAEERQQKKDSRRKTAEKDYISRMSIRV